MGKSINYGEDKLHYREFILYKFGSAFPEYRIDFKRSAANVGTSSDAQCKSQTEVTLLNEKLIASERQFDNRHKELNNRYSNMKKQYEHLLSYTEEFFEKLYPHIQFKTESKECIINKSIEENNNKTNDSDNDILEIIMEDEPNCHVFNIFS
ncbi:unnamed protein product [Rotaria sp. Silwood1]|nr:unnamed protein product [Rotaria sp. Silwood1]